MKPSLHASVVAAAAGVIIVTLLVLGADKGPKRTDTEVFMRTKLIYSQNILEGLALEKFDQVSRNAIKLREMTMSNTWLTLRNPDYMAQTTNYARAADQLYLAAVDKQLDRSTEAYVAVARACVDCHRMVRLEQHKRQLQSNSR